MSEKKYAVWIIGSEDETKEYLYAKTHREASEKYRAKQDISIHGVETRKV